MMAAVDKLHKLYSTTFEPLVWARSVGLEAVNELDALKTAIITSAGGSPRTARAGLDWADLVGGGLSSLATGMQSARFLGEGLAGALGAGLERASKELGSSRYSHKD
jgi:ubiquinone biosynthesis monooxygenase Coq6